MFQNVEISVSVYKDEGVNVNSGRIQSVQESNFAYSFFL